MYTMSSAKVYHNFDKFDIVSLRKIPLKSDNEVNRNI